MPRPYRAMQSPTDIVGKRFGKLTVERYLRREPYKERFHYYYRCRCDCGNTINIVRSNLITDHTLSCGCLKRREGETNPCWTGLGQISGRLWCSIRHKAEDRCLPFEITIEIAWRKFKRQGGKCALTGVSISPSNHKGAYSTRTASLDRIDNRKGYVKGNIQWVHKDINWMKGKFPLRKFIKLCCAVTDHARGGS